MKLLTCYNKLSASNKIFVWAVIVGVFALICALFSDHLGSSELDEIERSFKVLPKEVKQRFMS